MYVCMYVCMLYSTSFPFHHQVPFVCAAVVTIEASDEAYGVFSFAAGPLNTTLEEAGTVTSEANSKLGLM